MITMGQNRHFEGEIIISALTGKWLGWVALLLSILGIFWQPLYLGGLAAFLAVVGLHSSEKFLNSIAIAIGVTDMIITLL